MMGKILPDHLTTKYSLATVKCQQHFMIGAFMSTEEKKTRKKLTLVEQKAKLEADKAKLAEQEAKIAVAELKGYVSDLKVANIGSLFSVVKANKSGIKDIDILRTLADIAGLKVNITIKPVATRGKRKTSK